MLATMRKEAGSQGVTMQMPELSDQQFSRWATLLEQRLGIAITPQRKAFLSSRLRGRMRELGVFNFDHYFARVTSPRHGLQEWSRLLDLLTIHETRFNRHPESFRLIEEHYLAPMLRAANDEVFNLKAWSVGCASGEEAYYLAMMFDRALKDYQGKGYYGVMGSDVSLESLAQARKGIYASAQLDGLDKLTVQTYFERLGDEYRITDKLRQRVGFFQLNVQNLEKAPFDKVDIIFCQNLLIYFTQRKRQEIAAALAQFLKPGGVMVLGIGEIVGWSHERLEPMKIKDTLAYRRMMD